MSEATRKFTNNEFVAETIDKGSDLYKTWLDKQLNVVNDATTNLKKNPADASKINETAKTWMDTQMNLTREFMNFSMNTMKTYMENVTKSMPALNGNKEAINTMFEKNMNMFTQWNESMQTQYDQMMKNFQSGDLKNAMNNMFNHTEMMNKFNQMWTPFVNAMQNNTFNMDQFNNMFKNNNYADFINKMFGFGGEMMTNMNNMMNPSTAGVNDMWSNFSKMFAPNHNPFFTQMNNMSNMFGNNPANNMANDMMKNWMNNFSNSPMAPYFQNMNNMFTNQFAGMPQMPNGQDMFTYAMSFYNNVHGNLQNAYAPMAKLMTPNETKTNMEAMSALAHKMNQFMIKQAEMQYVTYNTGMKAAQEVAKRMQEQFTNGQEFKGMNALFNEWLNISDKVFVELFESDSYAQLQAEYASLSHSLKKDSEMMMEKMMAHIPVITRTEMDDNYKTLYELKKRVTELEKQLENNSTAEVAK